MLNNFVANLFKKLFANFHQNQPSFVGYIMKKTFWSYFLAGHTVHFDKEIYFLYSPQYFRKRYALEYGLCVTCTMF